MTRMKFLARLSTPFTLERCILSSTSLVSVIRYSSLAQKPRKKGKPREPTAEEAYASRLKAYPLFSDLSRENDYVFKNLNAASTFLDYYRTIYNVSVAKRFTIPSDATNAGVALQKAALVIDLAPAARLPEYSDVTHIVGIGEAEVAKNARYEARIDCAERLYRCIKNPNLLCTSKGSTVSEQEFFASFKLKRHVCERLKQHFDDWNVHRPFSVDRDDSEESDPSAFGMRGRRSRRSRPIIRLDERNAERLIETMDIPKNHISTLPVYESYREIIKTIETSQVTILSAATGSGKTTQVPQYLLSYFEAARLNNPSLPLTPPKIVVTQPRRIAAKSVAKRIAEERGEKIGDSVGYSVRFENVSPSNTSANGTILFCTAGILLRRLQGDRLLSDITHLVLDEIHERDVFTDVLLLVVKKILAQRPDLKVVLMSATLQAERLANYFRRDGFRVGMTLDLSGTNHPVVEHYLEDVMRILKEARMLPSGMVDEKSHAFVKMELGQNQSMSSDLTIEDPDLKCVPYEHTAALINYINEKMPEGAILCFLPGWEEISALNKLLTDDSRFRLSNAELHLLHSTSPTQSADAIFHRPASGIRKIILATNIAESSVTISDVVYVVDLGKQKVMHYQAQNRVNMLEPCWISKANLRQRLGRAGRCQPGVYFGMMSRLRAETLPDHGLPELLRLGLDEVCLGLKAMEIHGNCLDILRTALDAPETSAVEEAVDKLIGLGAFTDDESLTPLGRVLSTIPIHPAMAKMLLLAVIFKVLDPVLTIVASLAERPFYLVRSDSDKFAMFTLLQKFGGKSFSDHITFHKIYCAWRDDRQFLNSMGTRLISQGAMFKVDKLRKLILRILKNDLRNILPEWESESEAEFEGSLSSNAENLDLVRLVLLSGFYPDIAVYNGKRNLYRVKNLRHVNTPGQSVNYEIGPRLLMTSEAGSQVRHHYMGTNAAKLPSRPNYFVFDDLLDIGQKLMLRSTAIDPLFLPLFAERPMVSESTDRHDSRAMLRLDKWLVIKADRSDAALLLEFRKHWNDYIQFVFDRRVNGQPLSDYEKEACEKFEECLLLLVEQTNLQRPLSV